MTVEQYNKAVFKKQIQEVISNGGLDFDAPLIVLGFNMETKGFTVLRNRDKETTYKFLEDVVEALKDQQ